MKSDLFVVALLKDSGSHVDITSGIGQKKRRYQVAHQETRININVFVISFSLQEAPANLPVCAAVMRANVQIRHIHGKPLPIWVENDLAGVNITRTQVFVTSGCLPFPSYSCLRTKLGPIRDE